MIAARRWGSIRPRCRVCNRACQEDIEWPWTIHANAGWYSFGGHGCKFYTPNWPLITSTNSTRKSIHPKNGWLHNMDCNYRGKLLSKRAQKIDSWSQNCQRIALEMIDGTQWILQLLVLKHYYIHNFGHKLFFAVQHNERTIPKYSWRISVQKLGAGHFLADQSWILSGIVMKQYFKLWPYFHTSHV